MSEFSSSAATETSDMELVPTTASIAFVWSAAKPLPCQMHWAGQQPHTPIPGRSPDPLKAASVSTETLSPPPAAQLQRGTSPPLRNPQLSEGTKEL